MSTKWYSNTPAPYPIPFPLPAKGAQSMKWYLYGILNKETALNIV
jgi:hypothetical protein